MFALVAPTFSPERSGASLVLEAAASAPAFWFLVLSSLPQPPAAAAAIAAARSAAARERRFTSLDPPSLASRVRRYCARNEKEALRRAPPFLPTQRDPASRPLA